MYPSAAARSPRRSFRGIVTRVEHAGSSSPTGINPGAALVRVSNLVRKAVDEARSGPPPSKAPIAPMMIALTGDVPKLVIAGEPVSPPLLENGAVTPAAAEVLSGKTVDIGLSGQSSIDLDFPLPNSPLPDLRSMIETEILFRSPFGDGMAYAIWVADESDTGGWDIRAAVTLRSVLDPVLAAIREAGARVGVVRRIRDADREGFAAAPAWTGSDAPVDAPAKGSGLAWKAPFLAGGILIASILGYHVLAEMREAGLERAAQDARATLAAQARAAQEQATFLAREKGSLQKLLLPGMLTQELPDGVWLEQMAIEEDRITITGYGPSAADVTRGLSGLTGFGEVGFASPVTRDNTQGIERFRIAAQLDPDRFGEAQ